MAAPYKGEMLDEYLRKRLMPVEGAIPHIQGIEMYGIPLLSGPSGVTSSSTSIFSTYDIDARIQRALRLSKEFLEPFPPGAVPRNSVDDHIEWLRSRPGYSPAMEAEYRVARSSEQVRVAEGLPELYSTAGYCWSMLKGTDSFQRKLRRLCTTRFMLSCSPSLITTERQRRSCLKTSTCVWPFRHGSMRSAQRTKMRVRLPRCCTVKSIPTVISGS